MIPIEGGLVSVSSVFYFSKSLDILNFLAIHQPQIWSSSFIFVFYTYDLPYLYIISVVPGFCHCYSKKVNFLVLQKATQDY